MSIPKSARVVVTEWLAPHTRLVELAPEAPLPFVGGQYVIVDTGLVLPTGKSVKRAYSIASHDGDPERFQLVVKKIPEGLGSAYLQNVEVGDELRFSGPWGKLHTCSLRPGRTLVLATDTGVTAALGLARGRALRPFLPECTFVWFSVSADDFVPASWVAERLPGELRDVRFARIAAVGSAERMATARGVLGEILREGPLAQAFVAGDGAVNYALLDDLLEAGVTATKDNVESFFNMPKKAPSAQVAV